MAVKAIWILVWFLAVPFCTGLFVTGKMEEEKESFLLTMLCGYAGMFAVFEIMTVPMISATP